MEATKSKERNANPKFDPTLPVLFLDVENVSGYYYETYVVTKDVHDNYIIECIRSCSKINTFHDTINGEHITEIFTLLMSEAAALSFLKCVISSGHNYNSMSIRLLARKTYGLGKSGEYCLASHYVTLKSVVESDATIKSAMKKTTKFMFNAIVGTKVLVELAEMQELEQRHNQKLKRKKKQEQKP